MKLAVPLSQQQIEAAMRLQATLDQWSATDEALEALAKRFPDFDPPSTLLKTVAINALYGTNVYAHIRMARHVGDVLAKTDCAAAGPELVERLAALPKAEGQKSDRRFHSFGSKFAHFFVSSDRFPIMDSYAAEMVRHHLGRNNYVVDWGRPYMAFVQNFQTLMSLASLKCGNREFDNYLWIAGQYRKWRRIPKAQINAELRALFENPLAAAAAELGVISPTVVGEAR